MTKSHRFGVLDLYKLPKTHFWHGRIDSKTDRDSFYFHQAVDFMSSDEVPADGTSFSVIGFECDEGVRRSGGQAGSTEAPNEIRRQLADLPYHLGDRKTIDVGAVMCKGDDMEKAQRELGDHVERLLKRFTIPIILGGGHETAYGHYLGVRRFIGPDAKLGIITIDAHFDLREAEPPTASTMLRQILEADANTGFLALGIQPLGNTRALFNKAEELGAHFILAEDLALGNVQKTQSVIDAFCADYDYIFLSLSMNSLSSLYAPGVMAPSPFGLEPEVVRQLLWHIVANEKVRSFDLCEVNPELDENGKTAKLAAYLVAEMMAAFH